jgi:hypothetical protein
VSAEQRWPAAVSSRDRFLVDFVVQEGVYSSV